MSFIVQLLFVLLLANFCIALPHLNVHVIAHSHDDVGWLKTVDQYYYGSNQTIQAAGVQYIIDSVILALEANPKRRFIYVEIAFFARWWYEQTPAMHQRVRNLVKSGQLEFTNGGWCMNDEAATHYEATIEQMAFGHEFLLKEFGVRPTIGWHIDPFGHSATQASLFAHMGFDAFFFARIDYQDYAARNTSKRLEMVWRPSKSLGAQSDIFTHVLYDTSYCYTPGFAFEWAQSIPIRSDHRLFDYNLNERADVFVKKMRERASVYRTNNVLETFGCDYQYENANVNFKNMDMLMEYINARSAHYGVTVEYSTPARYVAAVHAANLTWEVKTDDFFPYFDHPHAGWTGYFTSRPALKGYVRRSNGILHAATRAIALVGRPSSTLAPLYAALGLVQHHDAITGTERQPVADDYARRLAAGNVQAFSAMAHALGSLVVRNASTTKLPSLSFCRQLNMSICEPIEHAKRRVLPVLMYNPVAWSRTTYARLPVPSKNVSVLGPNGAPVAAQLVPNSDTGHWSIVFPTAIAPLGVATYFLDLSRVTQTQRSGGVVESVSERWTRRSAKVAQPQPAPKAGTVHVENGKLRLTYSTLTNLLIRVDDLQANRSVPLSQNFHWYNSSTGNNVLSHQASGAYIFRPNSTSTFPCCTSVVCGHRNQPVHIEVHRGPWVNVVRQVWGAVNSKATWVTQETRLYAGASFVELEATVGPIPIHDPPFAGLGKEVIQRFESNIASGDRYYSDAQGDEMQLRRRNYRPTWSYKVNEPVSGNYVPQNAAAYIQEPHVSGTRLTVVTDRSSGTTSLKSGQLELMMHRRLLKDDARGVGEPLNETEAIRAISNLVVGPAHTSSRIQRSQSIWLNHPVEYAFAAPVASPTSWLSHYKTTVEPLVQAVPANVQLVTFALQNQPNVYLIRLHHIYAVGEDATLSGPVTVDLSNLFKHLTPVSLEELSLSANQPLSQMHRLKFRSNPPPPVSPAPHPPQPSTDFKILLRAMETRTFHVTMK